jgi:CubicO group peptidase (beta-lactamase class C family)
VAAIEQAGVDHLAGLVFPGRIVEEVLDQMEEFSNSVIKQFPERHEPAGGPDRPGRVAAAARSDRGGRGTRRGRMDPGRQRSRQAASGLADLRAGRPMRPDLHFRAGSITKSFVATVVLQLVAEGRLSLDDTVQRRLPGILPDGDRITVRHLLNHTSGVPHDWATIERELVALVADQPLKLPGGHGLVVLQHRLHPARPGGGDGYRPCAGSGAGPAHLQASQAA